MPRREVNHLKPLANTPLQAYFDNRLQLADVIDQVLRQIGPAELVISTFSTSDAFIRRLHRLKNEGRSGKVLLAFCRLESKPKNGTSCRLHQIGLRCCVPLREPQQSGATQKRFSPCDNRHFAEPNTGQPHGMWYNHYRQRHLSIHR